MKNIEPAPSRSWPFRIGLAVLLLAAIATGAGGAAAKRALPDAAMPRLEPRHGAVQLIVDGAPFLIRGGELENSTASSRAFLRPLWPRFAAMHFNTLLAPVYWELIEPQEGRFDFSGVDGLIADARAHNLRLVLLWFGSWKNSMSSYVPAWVKRDRKRFPHVVRSDGGSEEILTAFGADNLAADARAFAALMSHLRRTDARRRTVIMVQVENEVGMIPEAREHGKAADAAFLAPVPKALTDYLAAHRDTLAPVLRNAWQVRGFKTDASWPDTFGEGPATDEFFNAWFQARYTGDVAARGKAIYPLPLFVNAALIRPGRMPGQYPSGGPLPQVFDIWRAAAPALDFLAPDLYFPNFAEWAEKYAKPGAAFFIPETGRVNGSEMAANALYAFGKLRAAGFSPYAPEYLAPDDAKAIGKAYDIVGQLTPLILSRQGTDEIAGIHPPVAFDGGADLAPQTVTLGDYRFSVRFGEPPPTAIGAPPPPEAPGAHGGLILQTGPDEFLVAGTGMIVQFGLANAGGQAGIESIQEGSLADGRWQPGRTLNGDDSNQGRYLRVPFGDFTLHRVRLYRYR
jgi:hypothetical protein